MAGTPLLTLEPTLASPRRRDLRSPLRFVDWSLPLTAIAIAVFGIAMNYSTTWRTLQLEGGDPYHFAKRQVVFVAIGIATMTGVAFVDYRFYRVLARQGYVVLILALAGLQLFGTEVNGAAAWYTIGSFQLQPSEFGKVVLIVSLAAFVSRRRGDLNFADFCLALLLAAVPAALIIMQPDVGTALVYAAIAMGSLLLGGGRTRHILLVTLLAVTLVATIAGLESSGRVDILSNEQERRLTSFTDRDEGTDDEAFTLHQSQIAIGAGGVTGRGYLEGTQTNLARVPEQRTDFIFTAVAEEFGFIGAAGLLAAYAFLMFRIWQAARTSADLFGTVACAGVFTMILFHVFQNVGMTVGIMPITGIPLIFLSHGGSSVIASFAAIGLVLNVRARRYSP